LIKLLIFIFLFFPTLSLADAQNQDLINILNNLHTMQADFTQLVSNDAANVQQSSGTMVLRRPGKFRWEVLNPTKQLIVVNNSHITIYDVDLNQVSKQKIDYKQSANPAILLSSSAQEIKQNFIIKRLQQDPGVWFELKSKTGDSLFQTVQLQFIDDKLNAMYIVDSLEQKTKINFLNVKLNQPLDDQTFIFVPPKGADVI
jgi:outer membrane lipoprotein carrier protein